LKLSECLLSVSGDDALERSQFFCPLPTLPDACQRNAMYRVSCRNESSIYVDNRHVRQFRFDFSQQTIGEHAEHAALTTTSIPRFQNDIEEVGREGRGDG
jgi:hypothetical protein